MSNLFANITKVPELRNRVIFTLGLLAVYRLGIFVPSPGVNREVMQEAISSGPSLLGLFNLFSGGALERFSVFALGIMPYISASIIIQLLAVVLPSLERLKKEGEQGQKKITQYTRYGTVALCLVQGVWMARLLENLNDSNPGLLVSPGMQFMLVTVISLTTGTAFLMWLGEQITERGVGNGISLIITAGIVVSFPGGVFQTFQKVQDNTLQPIPGLVLALFMLGIVAIIVFFEKAQRRIPVQYARRAAGRTVFAGESSYLPLKLNISGVIPPIFASAMLIFPTTIAGYFPESALAMTVQEALNPLDWRYNFLYIVLIVFFCFFYTAVVFNPVDVADNMKRSGSFIPGIRPGRQTAEHIDYVLTRITTGGAVYLATVCVLPVVMMRYFPIDFFYGGTSLLIVVSVGLDTVQQMEGYLITREYESVGDGRPSSLRDRVRTEQD